MLTPLLNISPYAAYGRPKWRPFAVGLRNGDRLSDTDIWRLWAAWALTSGIMTGTLLSLCQKLLPPLRQFAGTERVPAAESILPA